MAPGAKFSTMTSARLTMSLTSASPRPDFRFTVMDFLLALNNRKYQESWFWFSLWLGPDCRPNKERPASPPCGFSTLTTSAPSQASASVQDGPASNWVRSRTRTPARQPIGEPFVAILSFLLLIFSIRPFPGRRDRCAPPAHPWRERPRRQLARPALDRRANRFVQNQPVCDGLAVVMFVFVAHRRAFLLRCTSPQVADFVAKRF